MKEGIFSRP